VVGKVCAINEVECSPVSEHVIDKSAPIIEGPTLDTVVFDRDRIRVYPCIEFGIGREFDANGLLSALADQEIRYVPGIELYHGIRIF
jgi:hypothetical protein